MRSLPRVCVVLRRGLAPGVALVAAAIFWLRPALLSTSGTQAFKAAREALSLRLPAGEAVPYLGDRYWIYANPLLYYAERLLDVPSPSAAEALAAARARKAAILLVDRERLDDVRALAGERPVFVPGPEWSLLDLSPAKER